MPGGIYLRRGDELIEMTEQRYATEADLQRLLASHPDLLTADGEPHRWLLISREFGIASASDAPDRWSVDHLFIDEAAVPTLVEVKRSTDTRIRREVVGQMLDYAANALSHWSEQTIRERYEARCADADPNAILAAALGEEVDADVFWETLGTNLSAGRLRLVFIADHIPDELRAIVEFLNEQMTKTEVLAIEVRQYLDASSEHHMLVPRVIGQTQAARRTKGRPRRTDWEERTWLEAFREARGDREAGVVERLFRWAAGHDPALTVEFGTGAKNPGARFALAGSSGLFTIYRGYAAGYVEVPFAALSRTRPFDALSYRLQLRDRLAEIAAVAIADDQLQKYPSVPIAALADPASCEHFIRTIDWVARELAGSGP